MYEYVNTEKSVNLFSNVDGLVYVFDVANTLQVKFIIQMIKL